MKIKPLPTKRADGSTVGRVFVARHDAEEKSSGAFGKAIIIPDSAKQENCFGTVCFVSEHSTLRVDDKVIVSKYGGSETTIEGKKYVVLKDDDVFAVIS